MSHPAQDPSNIGPQQHQQQPPQYPQQPREYGQQPRYGGQQHPPVYGQQHPPVYGQQQPPGYGPPQYAQQQVPGYGPPASGSLSPQQPAKKRRKWPWIIGGIVAAIAIGSAASSGGDESTATPAAVTSVPAAAPPPAASDPARPPAAPPPAAEPVQDDQHAFGEVWTSGNGNTVTVGRPEVGASQSPLSSGEQVVTVPITLQNNGDEEWATVFTTYAATLNGRPLQSAVGEGDWAYSTPLAPGRDVTLNQVFTLTGDQAGELEVTVSTPHGTAFYTGTI